MYTACPYFRVRVLANKNVKIGLNLLYLFLEKNLDHFCFIAHTGTDNRLSLLQSAYKQFKSANQQVISLRTIKQ